MTRVNYVTKISENSTANSWIKCILCWLLNF